MESKLTKKERHQVYKAALYLFKEEHWRKGLCLTILDACDYLFEELDIDIEDFPEFMSRKPSNNTYWWTITHPMGRDIRISVLLDLINETA